MAWFAFGHMQQKMLRNYGICFKVPPQPHIGPESSRSFHWSVVEPSQMWGGARREYCPKLLRWLPILRVACGSGYFFGFVRFGNLLQDFRKGTFPPKSMLAVMLGVSLRHTPHFSPTNLRPSGIFAAPFGPPFKPSTSPDPEPRNPVLPAGPGH